MADIDSIISGAAGNTRVEIPDFAKAFFDSSKQRADFDSRRAFKDGVPVDATGQPDFGAISRTFFQKGDVGQGLAAAKMDLERQRLKFGMDAAGQDFPSGASNPDPSQPAPVGPPSSNRSASVVVAPPLNRGGTVRPPAGGAPQGDQQGSIVGMVSSLGVPDELAGPIIAQVSAATRTDPNATVNPQIAPRVQQIVQEAVRRQSGGGGQPQPPQAQPQPQAPVMAQAQPQEAPDFNSRFSAARPGQGSDPTLGGLVPAGRTPQQQLELLSRRVASGLLAPEVAKVYEARIKALQDVMQPTGPIKEYDKAVQQGFKGTFEDWQNRADENTTQRDILTKSIIPRLEKSQEKASAARDDIDTIHRARTELDRPGGIFSGALAGEKLDLARAAELFGISNEKIANTQAFSAAAGQRVASLIKAFGSGTAISDGDRRFTQDIAAGRIQLDERSIRRLFDIGETAGRLVIERHNSLADKAVSANEGLKAARGTLIVEPPGAYKRASAPAADPYAKARDAIAAGAPRDAVMKRLQQSGFDPGKL